MAEANLPPLKPYHPTTFEERGVAVPFTTPMLGGTRARLTHAQAVELVIPNPSGGRGVYVMPWTAIASWCRPTLHDTVFNERIAELHHVTPATIRRVGLQLAGEGLAGEEAVAAALAATNAQKNDRLVTNYRLLMTLVQQVKDKFPTASFAQGSDTLDLMAKAQLTVDWVSPRLGQTVTWTATTLEALSDVMANIGVGSVGAPSRLSRLLNTLRETRSSLMVWSKTQYDEEHARYVDMICVVADLTLSLADAILAKAQAVTADMIGLLRTWATEPKSITQLVARPEWLLDGWEQICQIWSHAQDDAEKRAAIAEIVGLVPIVPKEASEWSDTVLDTDNVQRFRRLVTLNEDWRTGSMIFDLIARNEHFRATAC